MNFVHSFLAQTARRLSLATVFSLSLLAGASAQSIVAPVTPDAANTFTTAAPNNTGCDVTQDSRGQLRVFVWESSSTASTIGWEWTPASGLAVKGTQTVAGPGTGAVTDPDVVVARPPNNTSPFYILVAYVHKPAGTANIHYEMWSFNPSISTTTISKVFQNTANTLHVIRVNPTTTATCSSPNVDINTHTTGSNRADACIVYEQNGNIFARTRRLVNRGWSSILGLPAAGSLDPVYQANATSAGGGITYSQPDVAVSYEFGGDKLTHITYIENNTVSSTKNVLISQPDYSGVQGGGTNPGYPENSILSAPLSNTVEFPRVATPATPLSGNDFTDYCVVVRQSIASPVNQVIWALGQSQSTPFSTDLNTSIKGCTNEYPVVTYAGDAIDVSWQYRSAAGCTASTGYDILQRWLYWSGGIGSANYSRVNSTATGDQRIPCTAGRDLTAYPSPFNSNNAMYGFYDANAGAIKFKLSNYSNQPLRPASPTPASPDGSDSPMEVYPNPANGAAMLHLPVTVASHEVVITDLLTGRTIVRRTVSHTEATLRTLLPASTPAGVYVARVPTAPTVRPVRFQYQP